MLLSNHDPSIFLLSSILLSYADARLFLILSAALTLPQRHGLVRYIFFLGVRAIVDMGLQFCLSRQPLPSYYSNIQPGNMPLELQPQFTTIEYILNKSATTPPIFLYVVDTCLDDSDLQALKDTLIVSLSLLPPTALIGLITYGTMVIFLNQICTKRRLKFMKLDIKNAPSHMCSVEQRSTRQNRFRTC